jgi:hypothetical protein
VDARQRQRAGTPFDQGVGPLLNSVRHLDLLVKPITAVHHTSNGQHLVYYRGHRESRDRPDVLLSLNWIMSGCINLEGQFSF